MTLLIHPTLVYSIIWIINLKYFLLLFMNRWIHPTLVYSIIWITIPIFFLLYRNRWIRGTSWPTRSTTFTRSINSTRSTARVISNKKNKNYFFLNFNTNGCFSIPLKKIDFLEKNLTRAHKINCENVQNISNYCPAC